MVSGNFEICECIWKLTPNKSELPLILFVFPKQPHCPLHFGMRYLNQSARKDFLKKLLRSLTDLMLLSHEIHCKAAIPDAEEVSRTMGKVFSVSMVK
jgi:hypothetical protein